MAKQEVETGESLCTHGPVSLAHTNKRNKRERRTDTTHIIAYMSPHSHTGTYITHIHMHTNSSTKI